jgi:hypothetical protein
LLTAEHLQEVAAARLADTRKIGAEAFLGQWKLA